MAKLRDKAAKQVVDSMRSALKGNDIEVYECDKGDGNLVFVEKGEHLPDGWITKRGPKGVFHYCPNHNTQAPAKKIPNFFGGNDHGESDE
jgi:hypothetical protein